MAQHPVAVQTQGKKEGLEKSKQLFSRMGQINEHTLLAAERRQTAAPVTGLWPRSDVQSVSK